MKVDNKVRATLIIILITLSVVIIGVSYAYFTSVAADGESASTISAKGGKLTIVYEDNDPNIVVTNISPRDEAWVVKDFTVTGNNNTDLAMSYELSLVVDNNTFSENALSYSLEGENTSNTGYIAEDSEGYINSGTEFLGLGEFLTPGTNMVHTYTLKIYFKDTNTNQNIDQSKSFAGHVVIGNGEGNVLASSNIGKRVNFVSKYSSDLIWRLFYADKDYVYLISSKLTTTDSGNSQEAAAQITTYGGLGGVGLISQSSAGYNGTADITDPFLRSLNSLYFDALGGVDGTNDTDKALAWFFDQKAWKNWKDAAGNARYAIAGPSVELLVKSFNKTAIKNNRNPMVSSISYLGYSTTNSNGTLTNDLNYGIYHLPGQDETFWLVSPGGNNTADSVGKTLRTSGGNPSYGSIYSIYFGYTYYGLGIRPIVIIPTSTYRNANYEFLDY